MKFNSKKKLALAASAAFLAIGAFAPGAQAADHRDSFAVDALPEGDFTDVFAYVDPANNNNVILSFMVNSFANPGLNRSYRFAGDYLYQMKINNSMANGVAEDLVLQVQFNPNPRVGIQDYSAILGVPNQTGVRNTRITNGVRLCGAGATPTNLDAARVTIGQVEYPNFPGRILGPGGNFRVGNGSPNTSIYVGNNYPVGQPELSTNTAIGGNPANSDLGTAMSGVSRDKATYTVNIPAGQVTCFAGTADDSFQTDVAQAVFRMGLNPSASWNNQDHTQELFRGYAGTGSILSGLRGRPVRLDGTSGVDGFGGFSGNAVAISIPKSLLRGTGIPDVALNGAINPALIGVWGAVGRPTEESFDGFTTTETTAPGQAEEFAQFERMGQQIAATTFMFQQTISGLAPPLTVADWNNARALDPNNNAGPLVTGSPTSHPGVPVNKDLYNAVNVTTDFALQSRTYPSTLTQTSVGGNNCAPTQPLCNILGNAQSLILGGNTVKGRRAILTILGFNSNGLNGVNLFPMNSVLATNTNPRLQAQLGVPDYMRLNLDIATDGIRPGAATAGNDSPTLGLYRSGLQNGRRPADDVTDIVLRITRETADVKFPTNLVLPGLPLATVVPGSQTREGRNAVNCDELQISGSSTVGSILNVVGGLAGLLQPGASDGLAGLLSINVLRPCEDPRVFVVLQGTDWIEPTPAHLNSVADQYSADNNTLLPTFPYFGNNGIHGESDSPNYGPQK